MHEKVKRFMDFWSESRTSDRAGHMAKAYRSAIAELAALKAKSVEYLVPVKSGETFVVGFDPDRLEEVATLADRIEKQKDAIAEIESDIESFMSVVDHPMISTLVIRVRQLANQVQSAVTEARNVAQAQAALHPDLLPTQVAVLPNVVATAERCVQVKEETNAQIRELQARLVEATKIFSKYIA